MEIQKSTRWRHLFPYKQLIDRAEWGKKWHFLGTKINYERCGDFFSDFLVWTEHYGCLLFPPIICAMKNDPKGGQPPFFFGPSVTHFTPLSRGKMGHSRSLKKNAYHLIIIKWFTIKSSKTNASYRQTSKESKQKTTENDKNL